LYDSHPNGPAWFAGTIGFSLHAGMRWINANANLYMNKYKAMVQIPILSCPLFNDFYRGAGWLNANGLTTQPQGAAAKSFCQNMAVHNYAGYSIGQDAIRHQPEYIICEPDIWLDRFSNAQNGHVTCPVKVAGHVRTTTYLGQQVQLTWPGTRSIADLIDPVTNNQILLERQSRVITRRGRKPTGAGPNNPSKLIKPTQKPSKSSALSEAVSSSKNATAVKLEDNGGAPFWDDADVK